MEHIPTALQAIKIAAPHYEKIRDPAQRRIAKARGQLPKNDPDLVDARVMEDKGYVLRKRSEVQSDEEIVEVVRHRGQVLPRRPRNRRQTSSLENLRGGGQGRYRRDGGGYGSDSESSVPPRGRKTRSTTGRSRRGRSSSSSSSSSSQLGSSTEEEKEMKKVARKKWITAGLASVATIHAASKIYSSIENHDKRVIAVQQGEISPEEAHKQARTARWQDAAAIGIAALGIKGAISEWKEMTEEHERHKELMEKHEEQHRRRIEHLRHKRAKEMGGYYKGRDGEWYYDGAYMQSSARDKSRPKSSSSYNTYDQLEGPRQGDRKMIEGPPPRDRSRSAYDWDRDRSRARSSYGRDRDDESRSPVRAKSRGGSPNRRVPDENKQKYLEKYRADQHGEYKDFAADAIEEVLGKVI